MAVVFISSFGGVAAQFFDANGDPLSGGKIYSYLAGTTTFATTYTASNGNVAHSNPIILDAAGRVPGGEIWQPAGTSYKFVLRTATDVLIATYDNVSVVISGAYSAASFTGNGTQVQFTLPTAVSDPASTMVYVDGIYQMRNTFSAFTTTLLFTEAPPFNAVIEVLYL